MKESIVRSRKILYLFMLAIALLLAAEAASAAVIRLAGVPEVVGVLSNESAIGP
jgi:hypothetical protein